MTESMNIEDFEGWNVYSPDDIQFSSIKECEEVLNSEEFEEYVTTLASRNSYATRYGFRMRNGRFFMDLLRCTEAARRTFEAQLAFEGTTFEEYKKQHYCECMITRDHQYEETTMPDEICALSLENIELIIGKLTEEQERNYFEKTKPLSEEEVKEWIRRFREIPNTLGWKWIMKTDSEFGNKQ